MAVQPVGADVATGELPAVVEDRIGTLTVDATGRRLDAVAVADSTVSANVARFMGKIERGIEDARALIVSDSTYLWAIDLAETFAANHPTHKVTYRVWNTTTLAWDSQVTVATGTGARTIHFEIAAAGGRTTWYFLGDKYPVAVTAKDHDVIFVNEGHNEGSLTGGATVDLWRSQYLALTETLAETFPLAGIVVVLQNPETNSTEQQIRARAYEEIAHQRGYGVIDVLDAFLGRSDWTTALMADAIHPNAAGYEFWAQVVASQLSFSRVSRSGSATASSLSTTSPQLLPNGSFAAFTAATPDGFSLVNATVAKDTTNYESANGYGVRIQAAGATFSRIYGQLSAAQTRALRDQWITLAVRLRVPVGSLETVGRISLFDSVQPEVRSRAMVSPPTNGFLWRTVSMKVSPTATSVQASVFGDTGSNAAADVTIDGMYLVRGILPRRAA